MITAKKSIQILFVSILYVSGTLWAQELPSASPDDNGFSSSRLELLSKKFEEYANSGEMAGSVIMILRNNKVIYHEAFGLRDIEKELPMEKNTIFRIASQTKAITSVGIMMLQEQGKLLIGDRVSKYIPEFNQSTVAVTSEDEEGYEVVSANREITIRDLLTHTAGIGYGWGPAQKEWEDAGILGWYFADKEESIGETVGRLAKLPMNAHPGEQFVYGYNTDILGAVIEKVSGMPLDEFFQVNIFEPLGMKDTHFYLPGEKSSRLATVYSADENGIKKAPNPGGMIGQGAYIEGPRASFSGGAGLLSTAEDYGRFLLMMYNNGEYNGNRLLSPTTIRLMVSNHLRDIPFNDGEGFGLGYRIVLDPGARGVPGGKGEYGWGGAYGSSYWVDPENELIVVYFKQLIPTNGLDDQSKLRTLIYQALVK